MLCVLPSLFNNSLARALIRKSKILVMDEATSSIDQKTDFLVQNTIQREFVNKGVSVITVAHRLDTILGYDKIAVFGGGLLLEYDTPSKLLSRANGELRMLFNAYRKNRQRGLLPKEVELGQQPSI
jgi:ABC-type multidrug transport system fused ATPase/permease subunit